MKTSTKRNFRLLAVMASLLFACATANASLVRFEYGFGYVYVRACRASSRARDDR